MRTVSILIPVWNEAKNIESLIKRLHVVLSENTICYELIFIDDHSTDGTVTAIQLLSQQYPIFLYPKKGKRGKAHSIIEGVAYATYDTIVMIDADLQYPPEAIPHMLDQIVQGADVVVANRTYSQVSKIRQFFSTAFKIMFGKVLFQLDHDVQAGLKIFTKEVIETVRFTPVSGWTFDLEFLHRAKQAGFRIENFHILFEKRQIGTSKINIIKTSWEIGMNALAVRCTPLQPQRIKSEESGSMRGAGIGFKKRKYITHSTLHHSKSAVQTFILKQLLVIGALFALAIVGFILHPIVTFQILVGILSFIYFIDVVFNLFLILKSLHIPQEISFSQEELNKISEKDLPVYSILCPLYKEAHVIPQFVHAISGLDWPKKKLDVLLLLEEDDKETIEKVKQMNLPSFIRTVIVPHSFPKTKPKACNYGLSQAKGEYLVIFDAEDIPDPLQLKKAYLGFKKVGSHVLCLQAKLNYYNPHQNLLTRFFTAEYSLWFDVTLTGLQSIHTSIPLGGTSNHFRTADLNTLEGWDPFNVTEDADLGIRLFKEGYQTAIIDSTTMEEANSKYGNWLRQRSRWIKGYMQTYLVHTRETIPFFRKKKGHALVFHLVIGGKIAFILINPLLWLLTVSYFTLYAFVGPTIESLYPSFVFYMAASSLVFGNFLFLYYYMIGCAKKGQWELIKYVYLVPVYWLMISVAGCMALYQLIFKPHYWEKTLHGLHLKSIGKEMVFKTVTQEVLKEKFIYTPKIYMKLKQLLKDKKVFFSGLLLVGATMGANVLNFIFNIYLGRTLRIEEFGELSLFTSLLYITSIPLGSFSLTISHNIAYLFGKQSKMQAQGYLWYIFRKSILYGIILTVFWVLLTPVLSKFFQTDSIIPILFFSPLWFMSVASANFSGYLAGTLSFGKKGLVLITESIARLIIAVLLIRSGLPDLIFLSIVISMSISVLVSWVVTKTNGTKIIEHIDKKFNTVFFITSTLNGISLITFLTLDVILVKHFLSPVQAGQYALLSLVGKMTYFLGSLFGPFMVPLVSHNEGAKKDSVQTFSFLFFFTLFFSFLSFLGLGLLGKFTVPFIFGTKTLVILPLLIPYILAMALFTISQPIVSFFQAKENYTFAVAGFFVAILQIVLTTLFHKNLGQIVFVMLVTSIMNLGFMLVLYFLRKQLWIVYMNCKDFSEIFLFKKKNTQDKKTHSVNIIIFNWRDKRHKWAGGAEAYIHELSKRWVANGNHVTIFCGNDGKSPRNQVVDGVQYIRRGGFYTVYIWAFLYYILRFRDQYDVIIDSENGIPFFTPLYAGGKKIFLLIHHVHQEVFRTSLRPPFSWLAQFLEKSAMPFIYKNVQVITVSPSSKKEILYYKLTKTDPVVIYNGVDLSKFIPGQKSKNPVVLYLGRLQHYKSLHIFIQAAQKVLITMPNVSFIIAGSGEDKNRLQILTEQLHISDKIQFLGTVTEEEKIKLFQRAWIFVNPSRMEGWGITTIEANACGTPVIGSDVPGLKDSIKHLKTGYLIEYGNSEVFAEKIIEVLTDETLRENLGENALTWSKEFDWNVSSEQFYTEIVSCLYQQEKINVLGLSLAQEKK